MKRTYDIGARGNTWIIVAPSGPYWIGFADHEQHAWDQAWGRGMPGIWMPHSEIQTRKQLGWYATPCEVTWKQPQTHPQARTFMEWRELGYSVVRGERHIGRRSNNECLFGPHQVVPRGGYTGNGRKYPESRKIDYDMDSIETAYDLGLDGW